MELIKNSQSIVNQAQKVAHNNKLHKKVRFICTINAVETDKVKITLHYPRFSTFYIPATITLSIS